MSACQHEWEMGGVALSNPPIAHRTCRLCGRDESSRGNDPWEQSVRDKMRTRPSSSTIAPTEDQDA